MTSTETNEALSQRWPVPFLTAAQEAEIRRETAMREVVIDWHDHVTEMHEQQRAYRLNRLWGACVACLVSILGVGAFIWLAMIWGA